MSESSFRVIVLPSLVYPYFELDIKQDEIRKPLLIKQKTEWLELFWGDSRRVSLLDTGRLLERGVKYNFNRVERAFIR